VDVEVRVVDDVMKLVVVAVKTKGLQVTLKNTCREGEDEAEKHEGQRCAKRNRT
jgi:hypothetical protein